DRRDRPHRQCHGYGDRPRADADGGSAQGDLVRGRRRRRPAGRQPSRERWQDRRGRPAGHRRAVPEHRAVPGPPRPGIGADRRPGSL
ncbi:MAG: Cysteine synthase, partial [uncultured Nocardioides sp.]